MKHVMLLCVLSCCIAGRCVSQDDTLSLRSILIHDAEFSLAGALHVVSAPARWQAADWGWAGASLASTGGAALLDGDLRSAMQRSNSAAANRWSDAAVIYGDGYFAVGFPAGVYGAGLLFHDRWLRETAVLAGTAIIVSSLITRIIKPVVGRSRPYMEAGNGTFHMFSLHDDENSFPSGHSVVAFSLSSVLAARIDNPLATIGLYGLACMTALSRVYTDQHWFSDVVFGGIFASAVGRSLVTWHENKDRQESGFHIVPSLDQIMFVYSF